MLGQRCKRWADIKSTSLQRLVFFWLAPPFDRGTIPLSPSCGHVPNSTIGFIITAVYAAIMTLC